jgi:hypothetical protein
MTEAEEEKILPHLAPDDRAIVLCGLDTLARLSSILNLKRSEDHKTHLTLYDTKNGQAYAPPVSKRLRGAIYWWTARGSNSRPPRCERGALPAELAAQLVRMIEG